MKWLNKLFGKKEKPKEETPLLPIEQPISVPIEENKNSENVMDIVQPEEPIAPTLQVYDDEKLESKIDYKESDEKSFDGERMDRYLGDEFGQWEGIKPPDILDSRTPVEKLNPIGKLRFSKPKKQAKKKDNRNPDDDKKSWPNSKNFTL